MAPFPIHLAPLGGSRYIFMYMYMYVGSFLKQISECFSIFGESRLVNHVFIRPDMFCSSVFCQCPVGWLSLGLWDVFFF